MKLVRDKIPQIIKESGKRCKYHTADMQEFKERVHDKMSEELGEFIENPCVEEAADIYEVMRTLLWIHDIDFSDAISHAENKRYERGGFCKGVVLESVDDSSSD
jgi:predicted house-cleaning noncanonical NTP pyrophosphatase (MazG superfamily)